MISPLRLMAWAPFSEGVLATSHVSCDGEASQASAENITNAQSQCEADVVSRENQELGAKAVAKLLSRLKKLYSDIFCTFGELDRDKSGTISVMELMDTLQRALSREGLNQVASRISRVTASELALSRDTFVLTALGWIGIDDQFHVQTTPGMLSNVHVEFACLKLSFVYLQQCFKCKDRRACCGTANISKRVLSCM
jgi:hypothetical protein